MTAPIQPMSDEESNAWWSEQPRRPKMTIQVELPQHTPVCSITCRVCGTRDDIAVNWDGLLCRSCRADLTMTSIYVKGKISATQAEMRSGFDAWTNYLDSLDDTVRDRFQIMVGAREAARAVLERAQRGKLRSGVNPMEAIEAAKVKLSEVLAKIERTRRASPELAQVLQVEAEYLAEVQRLAEQATRWTIAFQEVEAVRGEWALT